MDRLQGQGSPEIQEEVTGDIQTAESGDARDESSKHLIAGVSVSASETRRSTGSLIKTTGGRIVRSRWSPLLAVVLVSLIVGWFNDSWYDNDQWFMLSNGRWVSDNGFPHENPFSAWGGEIVLDNWLWSVILYTAYSLNGQTGITALCSIVSTASALTAWSIAHRLGASRLASTMTSSLFLICSMHSMGAATDRPFLASSLMILLAIRVVLEWSMSGWRWRGVWLLPLITLTAFNLHMADGWFTVILPGCWLAASVLMDDSHRAKTLVVSSLVVTTQILATLVNPWFLDGVTFVFKGMGSASYREAIIDTLKLPTFASMVFDGSILRDVELRRLAPPITMAVIIIAVLVAMSARNAIRAENSTMRAVWTGCLIAVIGTASLLFVALRFSNEVMLLSPFLAGVSIAVKPDSKLAATMNDRDMQVFMIVLLSFALASSMVSAPAASWAKYDGNDVANVAARAVQGHVPAGSEIMSDGYIGSKLTWLGYKTSFDMRPELIDSAVSGLPEDHYREWIDANLDRSKAESFIEEYSGEFRWWVIRDYPSGETIMETVLSARSDFKLVASQEDKYALYEHVSRLARPPVSHAEGW